MNTKRLSWLTFACASFSALFSLTLLSFHADISLIALPLALVFTASLAFFSIKKLFFQQNLFMIPVFRELLQYLPYVRLVAFVFRRAGEFGTSFALDVISLLFWLLASGTTLVILHYLNPKHISKVSSEWAAFVEKQKLERKNPKNKSFVKSTVREILSWIDALVQAVFMVLLLNIFIVQLYEIPSESMVPEFLIKDRVVVFKTLSGPKFPLSDVGLPYLKKYKRGDIVVFRNPHYANDRKSEVHTFLSQLVYMCTLTKVNLNVDEYGREKADPLVKRVRGLEGEQLMMQDGVLYARTKDSPEFKAVTDDADYAAWNINELKDLYNLSENELKIEKLPITCIYREELSGIGRDKFHWNYSLEEALSEEKKAYDNMISCEKERRNLSLDAAASEAKKIAEDFDAVFKTIKTNRNATFSISKNNFVLESIARNSTYMSAELLSSVNGSEWFALFMTDWAKSIPNFSGDLYSEANFKLNVMAKLTLGKLFLRNAQLYKSGVSDVGFQTDELRASYFSELQKLDFYTKILDNRNMPIFPANDENGNPQYIPKNCYFMMGDNRFNSLDMRHSYSVVKTPLTVHDEYSLYYDSNMAPQYVSRARMLGSASYRFWPVSRAEILGRKEK